MITRMMDPYCLMDWRDSSVVGQMTLTVAMTSYFLCDSPSFRSYCVSVQSAAVVAYIILCIDDVIVGFSRHVGSRPIYFPYKRCFKLR